MAAAGMAAALIFMSLFPFFRERAQASYTDPLISRSFVDNLFSVNSVQYKYLREKADQAQYSYSGLYLKQNLETDTTDMSSAYYGYSDSNADYFVETDKSSQEQIRSRAESIVARQKENLESILSEYEQMLSSYGGMMDYYVEDLESGTVLSNSGNSLPNAVAADGQDGNGSSGYVYYVSLVRQCRKCGKCFRPLPG